MQSLSKLQLNTFFLYELELDAPLLLVAATVAAGKNSFNSVILHFSAMSIWFSTSPRSVVSARSIFHDKFSISVSSFACWYSNRILRVPASMKYAYGYVYCSVYRHLASNEAASNRYCQSIQVPAPLLTRSSILSLIRFSVCCSNCSDLEWFSQRSK